MYRINCFTLCLVVVLVLTALPALAANKPMGAQQAASQSSFLPAPNELNRKAADALLKQIWDAQPGQPKFDAIDAVVAKYNQSDKATKDAVVWLCLTYMNDKSREMNNRWPCEYVLYHVRYEPAVPQLIQILQHDIMEAMRAVAAEVLGMWYKSTGDEVIREALRRSANSDTSKWVQETIRKYVQGPFVDATFPPTPDESHRKAADAMLKQIWDAQPGQPKFDAINAVVAEYNGSDTVTKNAIAWLCLTYMYDKSRGILDRWPCEYVLSYARYEPAMPHLIHELLNDEVEAMRAVAAEALGMWYMSNNNTAIWNALMQSAKTDKSKWVQDTIARYLSNNAPASGSSTSK